MSAPPRSLPTSEAVAAGVRSVRLSLGRVVRAESANYVLLLGITLFMVVFGLVMVLSSSSVDSHVDDDNFFAKFWSQGSYALIGVPLMLLVSRLPARFWRVWAWPVLGFTCLLQVLVVATPLGWGINGNRNWLTLGPVTFQPSEMIKIALVVWLGFFLAAKADRIGEWRYSLFPALLVSFVAVGLVMLGNDLGTVMILVFIVLGALFFAGTPLRHLVATGVVVAGLAVVLALASPSRLTRLMSFFQPHAQDFMSDGWQIQNGFFALASGGVFGVGLGNSESKWRWLPAADTDFIFAVIGEELGLIGALLVLALFVMLTVVFVRIVRQSPSMQGRVTTAAVMVWIVGQGLVNIAVVLGVLPVLGVPLPLISAGGTALISSLIAIGIVLSFARERPRGAS